MTASIDIFEEVDLLYQAVSDPKYLDQLLSNIRRKTNSMSGSIQIDDLASYAVVDGIFQGFSDSAITSYIKHYAPLDIAKKMAVKSPLFYTGTPSLEQLMDPKLFEASTFYNEWVKPQAGFVDTLGTCLLDYNKQQSLILTLQRDQTAGNYHQSSAQQYLAQLRPFLISAMRAMKVQRNHSNKGSSVHYIDHPAMLLDRSFTMLECNSHAQSLLQECSWLWTKIGDVLEFQWPLQDNIERCIDANIDVYQAASITRSELIYTSDKGDSFDVKVLPYRSQHNSLLLREDRRQMVLLTIKSREKKLDLDLLQLLYGFTRGETAIVSQIFLGLSIKQISEQTQRSEHTVRSALKAIFQKAAVNRQTELVVKVANSLAYQ